MGKCVLPCDNWGYIGKDWRTIIRPPGVRCSVTPQPEEKICWRLRLSSRRLFLSCPSQASRPAGCRVASPHAAASHLPAPLITASPLSGWLSRLLASHATTSHLPAHPPLIAPSPLVTPLSGLLSGGWLERSLSSVMPPPPIHSGIIGSSQWSSLMSV